MNESRRLSWIFTFDEHVPADGDGSLEIPEDLTPLSDDALTTLSSDLLETFNAVRGGELTKENLEEARVIALAMDRVRAEQAKREQDRQEMAAELEQLASRVTLQDEGDEEEEETEPEPEPEPAPETPEPSAAAQPQVILAPEAAPVPSVPEPARQGKLSIPIRKRLNVPLSEVRRRAPDPELGVQQDAMVLVAPDVPNYPAGKTLADFADLADAVHRRAKTLGNPSGQATVATIKREFDIVLDRDASPEAIWDVVRKSADPEHLVAAGGWCAPSTIIYDFFNIACDDGILDAPTVGVTRGGIRFPTSPSIADVLSQVWLWTETDDIAAATGGAGPTKPCARPACPTFNEERLDCHGICVTAGNLTESAFPELIANHIRLTMSAHRHVMNQRFIADMVANSTAVTVTGTDMPITTGLLGAVGLQAADYREKFRMCDDDVLEVVLPRWSKEAIRSDIAKRTGQDLLAVSDAQILSWFDQRMVRVQFVSDWQVGSGDFPGQSAARVAWPAVVQFLMYAAGTFVIGNGLDLDLGVVRDSTLNARNDHTAAWTEECHLVARIGHEARVVSVDFAVDGNTGAANLDGINMV